MPASFKVINKNDKESLVADFGEKAIGRVTPVDSSLWWLLLMRMYIKASGDNDFAAEDRTCSSIKRILDHYLIGHFELIPTLLVPDGAFMIDRRMGMYGHPLDIEVLFDAALRSSREILGIEASQDDKKYIKRIDDRISHLVDHIRADYWIDPTRLNSIYRYETEQFGDEIANKYNIHVSSIPNWVYQWMPENSGYFLGNIGPGRMDFRFLTVGNLLAVLTSLAEKSQQEKILRLLEVNWEVLVGSMPIKLCYPALEGKAWHMLTGADGKNTSWSYHNGGNWPTLLWLLIAAAMKMNNKSMAIKAMQIAAKRLSTDDWPEYYDGPFGNLIGKEARKKQVWTAAGFIAAHSILENPDKIKLLIFDN
jgi:glycogen debranching enzyme